MKLTNTELKALPEPGTLCKKHEAASDFEGNLRLTLRGKPSERRTFVFFSSKEEGMLSG